MKGIRMGLWFSGLILALSPAFVSNICNSRSTLGLIPLPVKMDLKSGEFKLDKDVIIVFSSSELESTARIFSEFLNKNSETALDISSKPVKGKREILLKLKRDEELDRFGKEAYRLEINEDGIEISAPEPDGVFNGAMTLLQIFLSSADLKTSPCLKILDYPRFSHRGLLLDPARHFLSVDLVKNVLDAMAQIKMNVLHFHLADDQGYRIESKVFPELHRVGGASGYYTQDELRELVLYAKERFITIEPELDIPGHSTAMLAGNPELSCSCEEVSVSKIWGIHRNALCPGKEEVYEFLEKLFKELTGIFPSIYIHTGGDEVMAKDWDDFTGNQDILKTLKEKNNHGLQCYFQARVSGILQKLERKMIVWDELTDCLPEGTAVQAWRSIGPVKLATSEGHNVIVSTVNPWYLDYPDWPWKLRRVYEFEPIPEGLSPEQEKLVMGGEGCLWGERAPEEKIMVKLFPRLLAISEVLWSPKESRDFNGFKKRKKIVEKIFNQQGINFTIFPVTTP